MQKCLRKSYRCSRQYAFLCSGFVTLDAVYSWHTMAGRPRNTSLYVYVITKLLPKNRICLLGNLSDSSHSASFLCMNVLVARIDGKYRLRKGSHNWDQKPVSGARNTLFFELYSKSAIYTLYEGFIWLGFTLENLCESSTTTRKDRGVNWFCARYLFPKSFVNWLMRPIHLSFCCKCKQW